MEQNKTVMEWNEEVKLLKKKIKKLQNDFTNKNYFVVGTKEENLKNKEENDKKIENFKSSFDSYKKLKKNINKIRQAIMEFNATHYINVAGETLSVALALEKFKSQTNDCDFLFYQVSNLNMEKKNKTNTANRTIQDMENRLLGGNRQPSKAEMDLLEETKEKNKIEVLDPLNIEQLYDEEITKEQEFLQKINIELNKINVQNTITIDLD